jgi:hypothetical protein
MVFGHPVDLRSRDMKLAIGPPSHGMASGFARAPNTTGLPASGHATQSDFGFAKFWVVELRILILIDSEPTAFTAQVEAVPICNRVLRQRTQLVFSLPLEEWMLPKSPSELSSAVRLNVALAASSPCETPVCAFLSTFTSPILQHVPL